MRREGVHPVELCTLNVSLSLADEEPVAGKGDGLPSHLTSRQRVSERTRMEVDMKNKKIGN